jgi:hypothetical protein
MKRILVAACLLAMTCTAAWAEGQTQAPTKAPATTKAPAAPTASAKQLEMMKAEMSKCAVCKNIAAHLDEIGPINMEIVKLDNGIAMLHSVPTAKVAAYQSAAKEMHAAGEQCMTMTDEQAKTQLCPMCQGFRDAMKAGAKATAGMTKHGDLCVFTSDDPAVQAQLTSLGDKCTAMMSQHAER